MLVWSLAALGLTVLTVADRDRASRGAAGLVLVALGTLSLLIGAGTLDPGRLARVAMTAAVPPWFLEVSLALVGLGLLISVAATRSWLVGAAALAAAFSLRLLVVGTSVTRIGIALLLLAITVGGLTLAARGVRGRLRTPESLQPHPHSPGWSFRATIAFGLLALVGRFGLEMVPLGLAWWLPAVFPVALVGVLRGLLASPAVAAAGSLAWLGLWIGTPASFLGALLLAATALAATLTADTWAGARWADSRILWACGGAGGVLVLWGGLTAQVVYSALLALLAAAALLQPRGVAASPGTA